MSSVLDQVDWNGEFVRRDLREAIQQLARESGNGLCVGGVELALALALTELRLIDRYNSIWQDGALRATAP